ncbi:DNA damage-regulated autophagy modulator protein 2 [Hydra vulgaris]|uniref:DNA damage-regulated autophagy modulator protein 2 n=1 Tax=Hydra vulgaris TaxID=6087 RepID=A0ABM4B3U7_HYDVU
METLVLIPSLFFTITVLGYIIPYIISTKNGHVKFIFPAISDTGINLPESFFFRQLLNLSGFLSICNVFVRYEQCSLYLAQLNDSNLTLVKKINFWCLINGIVGGIGVTFVANFRSEKVSNSLNADQMYIMYERSIHYLAAFLAFGTGLLYCILQTFSSYRLVSYNINTITICYLRLIITLSAVFNFLVFIIGKIVLKFVEENNSLRIKEEPWLQLRIISNFSEWLMCLSFTTFALTFIYEFQKIEIRANFRHPDNFSRSSHSISLPSFLAETEQRSS